MATNKQTINGVDVIEDGDVTHFVISDDIKKQDELKRKQELEEKAKDPTSWWKKLCRWFKKNDVHPYVKITDLSDPVGNRPEDDMDKGSDGKTAVEIGVKIGF